MGSYRFVVRHVGYWRGVVHRWSTSYVYSGTPDNLPNAADCETMLNWDDAMCYEGDASDGGTYECAVYDLSKKGTHIAIYTRFVWHDPSTWIGFAGTAWTTTGPVNDPTMENALVVEWPGGLGATGKPVYFRKWYHAVPASTVQGASAQVSAADVTSLQAHARTAPGLFGSNGLLLQSKAGRIAGSAEILRWYGNHQMPKGRKKKKTSSSSNSAAATIANLADQLAAAAAGL